jgi:hypothetical protein
VVRETEIIELIAVNPQGDIACDMTIATADARTGFADDLKRGMRLPIRDVPGGVEVRFDPSAQDAVLRYVDLESRCCSFLTVAVRSEPDAIVLSVTGRPEAREWIRNIFVDAS